MESAQGLLTIGDLAERTGVPAPTLRSWEARYDFPRPVRLPGGHRRYVAQDVADVVEVARLRALGLPPAAAIGRVAAPAWPTHSVYAELRRAHPEVIVHSVSKTTMLALSRAVEDECAARAVRPVLFAGFQREEFARASFDRWAELARTAAATVLFADFADPAPLRAGAPIEVALPADSPLRREWLVICDAPDMPVCLGGVELPSAGRIRDNRRRFELLWSVEPVVVRLAARVAAAHADAYRPGWRDDVDELLDYEPAPASADLRRAAGLLDRMLAYLPGPR